MVEVTFVVDISRNAKIKKWLDAARISTLEMKTCKPVIPGFGDWLESMTGCLFFRALAVVSVLAISRNAK